MRASIFWAVPLAIGAAAACSSSNNSGNSVTADQACTDLAAGICGAFQKCAPFYLQISFGDVSTCQTREKLACTPALSANGTGATPAAAESCAQAYQSASCSDFFGNNRPAACEVQGTLAAGTACGENAQCTGANAYCKITASSGGDGGTGPSTCGVCSTRVAAGSSCTSEEDCQSGLVCASDKGGSGTCVAAGAAGATCDAGHPCNGTLACSNGTCAQPGGAGATCDPTVFPSTCDFLHGYYCGQSKACAQIQIASAGQACGYSNGQVTVCGSGAQCKQSNPQTPGTCVAPAADGAACDPSQSLGCMDPAACVNKVCKLPDPSSCK